MFNPASVLLVTLAVLSFVVVPSAGHFGSVADRVVQPDVEVAIDCQNQPYDFVSGVASLGASAPTAGPNFVFTLGLSPWIYAASLLGSFAPIPLWSNVTANRASMGAQVRGAVMMGNSLFVVFSRNEVGSVQSNILQIDDPWGTPSFRVHPLGDVVVYDVVSTLQAIYILAQPKHVTELYNQVLRFDLARSFLQGVRLFNVTGGKLALSTDQKNLFVASTRPSCPVFPYGACTVVFNLDSLYLRTVWTQLEESGGCAINALATAPDNRLYLANSGRSYCLITRMTGAFDGQSWIPNNLAQENWASVSWALARADGRFLEGLGGVVNLYLGQPSQKFVLQSGAPLNFASPMMISDISLGQHLTFTGPGCIGGTLYAYAFKYDQFMT